jgi:hypothetical protein
MKASRPRGRGRRRAVAGFFAVVLLACGAALLYYSFSARGGGPGDASPPVTRSISVTPTLVSEVQQNGGRRVVVTSYITVTAVPSPGGTDFLPLLSTVTGLIASVAGIISAVVSVRPIRLRQ